MDTEKSNTSPFYFYFFASDFVYEFAQMQISFFFSHLSVFCLLTFVIIGFFMSPVLKTKELLSLNKTWIHC